MHPRVKHITRVNVLSYTASQMIKFLNSAHWCQNKPARSWRKIWSTSSIPQLPAWSRKNSCPHRFNKANRYFTIEGYEGRVERDELCRSLVGSPRSKHKADPNVSWQAQTHVHQQNSLNLISSQLNPCASSRFSYGVMGVSVSGTLIVKSEKNGSGWYVTSLLVLRSAEYIFIL